MKGTAAEMPTFQLTDPHKCCNIFQLNRFACVIQIYQSTLKLLHNLPNTLVLYVQFTVNHAYSTDRNLFMLYSSSSVAFYWSTVCKYTLFDYFPLSFQWPTEESFNIVDLISNFSYNVFSKHLIKFFQDLGWQVTLDEFDKNTVIGMKRFTNIIATANPNAKKFVLLTAHYDSKIMKGNEFLAATDSAVPCAMIMSIAKSLNLNELKKVWEFIIKVI